jgi:hypothetical protein
MKRLMILVTMAGMVLQGAVAPAAAPAVAAAGTPDYVEVTPPQPTTLGSVNIILHNAGHCCKTVFHDKVISVGDSAITLSYTYDDSLCGSVECFVAGSQTDFYCQELKAGTYSIYKVETPYCPPVVLCTLTIATPLLVGHVTIVPAVDIKSEPNALRTLLEQGLAVAGATVWVTTIRNATVNLCLYDDRGRFIARIFDGFLPAGKHLLGLRETAEKSFAKGIVIVRLSVNGTLVASQAVVPETNTY